MIRQVFFISLLSFLFSIRTTIAFAQLSAPGADYAEVIDYPSDLSVKTDSVFIFCGQQGEANGTLKVENLTGGETLSWEKYIPGVGYANYPGTTAQIEGLEDGGYRCVINNQDTLRAWISNFWSEAAAEITESNCDYFTLSGAVDHSSIIFYDVLNGNSDVAIEKQFNPAYTWNIPWDDKDYHNQVQQIYNPEASDLPLDIELVVEFIDFGCSSQTTVSYQSIVPEAGFSYEPMSGEAPLVVDFTSTSQNADLYKWYFFKNEEELHDLALEPNAGLIDSLLDLYDQGFSNPVENENFELTYYRPGDYRVSLVVETSEGCKDSLLMGADEFIKVDTSWVEVPNVFTPNNDGINDVWIIETISIRSLDVKLYNRWGKLVHSWQEDNITSGEDVISSAVWNGTILGKNLARPGVYFYIIKGVGWDDKKHYRKGSIHLFTDEKKL